MRFWLAWVHGALALVVAMVFAGQVDLRLSLLVVNEEALVARIVGPFGEWPGWLAVVASVALLALARRRPGDRRLAALRPLALAVILLALCHPLALTQALKNLWGRVRFYHLGRGLTEYTPFWVPAGVGAGRSFPSGHVAMSMVPAPWPFHLLRARRPGAAVGALLVVVGVGTTVSIGRIVAGKHYLTDTLFSFGVALLLAPLLLDYATRLLARRDTAPNGHPLSRERRG